VEFNLKVGDYVQLRNGNIGRVDSVRNYSTQDKYTFNVMVLGLGLECYTAAGKFHALMLNGTAMDIVRVIDLRDIDRLAALIAHCNSNGVNFMQATEEYLTVDEYKKAIDTYLIEGAKNEV